MASFDWQRLLWELKHIKFLWALLVYLCLSSGDLFIFLVKVSSFYSYFCTSPLHVIRGWSRLLKGRVCKEIKNVSMGIEDLENGEILGGVEKAWFSTTLWTEITAHLAPFSQCLHISCIHSLANFLVGLLVLAIRLPLPGRFRLLTRHIASRIHHVQELLREVPQLLSHVVVVRYCQTKQKGKLQCGR